MFEKKGLLIVGVAPANMQEHFYVRGADAYGIEYDSEKVSQFKREYPENAERVSVGDIETMEFENASFDLALLNEVLEHVPDGARALQEINRILKPKGILIIFSPIVFIPLRHTLFTSNTQNAKCLFTCRVFPTYPCIWDKEYFIILREIIGLTNLDDRFVPVTLRSLDLAMSGKHSKTFLVDGRKS